MNKQTFSIEIKASREVVWRVLWDDKTFRDWAGFIDEGTYMRGELKEGEEVEFISSVGGYGVRSLVAKLVPNESVVFKQIRDTKDGGASVREDEWTGGEESYSLEENNGVTTLTNATDIPPSQEELMAVRIPRALERIRELAEEFV